MAGLGLKIGFLSRKPRDVCEGACQMIKRLCSAAFAATALMMQITASAHHSFAMFDMTKTITLHGTVKEFQWTNPHCFVQLLVPAETGAVEWSIELNSTGGQYRLGWRPGTLKSGDAVTIEVHPAKDGSAGGSLLSATDPSGRTLR